MGIKNCVGAIITDPDAIFGGLRGGLAIGTMFMMVAISAMNGLSVAGMAIGA